MFMLCCGVGAEVRGQPGCMKCARMFMLCRGVGAEVRGQLGCWFLLFTLLSLAPLWICRILVSVACILLYEL